MRLAGFAASVNMIRAAPAQAIVAPIHSDASLPTDGAGRVHAARLRCRHHPALVQDCIHGVVVSSPANVLTKSRYARSTRLHE